MMRCPSNSIAHRDCCIGVSFPLVALEKYPSWKKKPARLIEVQQALMEIQGLLEVGALTAGERRDLQAACEAAADAIDAYDADHSQTRNDAYSAWCVMWFLGDEAFADALYYGGSWKKRPELWLKVKHIIGLTSDRLYLHHQARQKRRPAYGTATPHRGKTRKWRTTYGLPHRSKPLERNRTSACHPEAPAGDTEGGRRAGGRRERHSGGRHQ